MCARKHGSSASRKSLRLSSSGDWRTVGRGGKCAPRASHLCKSRLRETRLRKLSSRALVRPRDAAIWSGVWISAQAPAECDHRPRLHIRAGRRHFWRVLRPADERLHKRVSRRQIGQREGARGRRCCPSSAIRVICALLLQASIRARRQVEQTSASVRRNRRHPAGKGAIGRVTVAVSEVTALAVAVSEAAGSRCARTQGARDGSYHATDAFRSMDRSAWLRPAGWISPPTSQSVTGPS